MKYKHFITHVNNIELTKIAYDSIKEKEVLKSKIFIIDNSDEKELLNYTEYFCDAIIMYATQPLTTAQTMNWIREIAINDGLDVVSWQHNDAQPLNDTIEKVYEIAQDYINNDKNFGVIFTNYDTFCVFSTKALKVVGKWDWILFPFYYLDNDYYYRLETNGFEIVKTNLPCLHHNSSSNTMKNDFIRKMEHDFGDEHCRKLIMIKNGVYKKYD